MLDSIKNLITDVFAGPLHPLQQRLAMLAKINLELEARTLQLLDANTLLTQQQENLIQSAKMSALDTMASGMAHEINSPLTIITVKANQLERLCEDEALTSDTLISDAQLIATTAKRIGTIITGMRAIARDAGDDPFDLITIEALLQDALHLCQNRFKNHKIELRVPSLSQKLALECRASQIGQVLSNLLGNAFDAVKDLPRKWVDIEVRDGVHDVLIAVTDSGPGIAPEILDRIMDPFFTTKEIGKGMGLGLSIARGIVQSHQGSLIVDPLSANTKFVIRLPKLHPVEKLA